EKVSSPDPLKPQRAAGVCRAWRFCMTRICKDAFVPAPAPLLPLYHFRQSLVVDLPAQFFKSDRQMPPVSPPQSFSLEYTEKFEPFALSEISPPIGVNR